MWLFIHPLDVEESSRPGGIEVEVIKQGPKGFFLACFRVSYYST